MAAIKFFLSRAAFLVAVVVALVAYAQVAVAQGPATCPASLGNLNSCAPFVVPGTNNAPPSAECCGALQSVENGCICNTIRIAARLPALCNLPALNCA